MCISGKLLLRMYGRVCTSNVIGRAFSGRKSVFHVRSMYSTYLLRCRPEVTYRFFFWGGGSLTHEYIYIYVHT